jgi:hypothetical protein
MPEFYLVNEVHPGHDPTQPGDISVFPSAQAVEEYFEPWYVDETYLVLAQDGKRLVFKVDNGKIRIASSPDQTDYSLKLKELLVSNLKSVEHAVHHRRRLPDVGPIDFDQFSTEMLFKLALLFK